MLALLLSCTTPPVGAGDSVGVEAPDGWTLGPQPGCAAPVEGFERLQEQGSARGLDVLVETLPDIRNANGGLAVEDLDRDGDLDIVLGSLSSAPRVFENDGAGRFTEVVQDGASLDSWSAAAGFGVADLDGDGWPDLVQVGVGMALWWPNEGAMRFAAEPRVALWVEDFPKPLFGTFAAGDVDGDGDLDLVLPGLQQYSADPAEEEGQEAPTGSADLVLRNEGGVFSELVTLTPDGRPGVNITATFTDRDGDGDQDLLVPSDLGQVLTELPPTAFYRNDGGELTNDAPEIGADLMMSAMGVTTGDYNGDGLLDYCMSDVGPVRCLVSDGSGSYFDGGRAMGLVPAVAETAFWSAWGIELVDLDNDGILDAAAAGGAPIGGAPESYRHPDHLFRGLSTQPLEFEAYRGTDFDSQDDHYGLVAADMDGDGYVEVLVMGPPGPLLYWQNACGEGSWLEVDLDGPPLNALGVGARITVTADGHTEVREVQTLRAMMQGPARQHFGLGGAAQAHVSVLWPDGAVSEGVVETGRRVRVPHPDL